MMFYMDLFMLTFFMAVHACSHLWGPSSPGQGMSELCIFSLSSLTWNKVSRVKYSCRLDVRNDSLSHHCQFPNPVRPCPK